MITWYHFLIRTARGSLHIYYHIHTSCSHPRTSPVSFAFIYFCRHVRRAAGVVCFVSPSGLSALSKTRARATRSRYAPMITLLHDVLPPAAAPRYVVPQQPLDAFPPDVTSRAAASQMRKGDSPKRQLLSSPAASAFTSRPGRRRRTDAQ